MARRRRLTPAQPGYLGPDPERTGGLAEAGPALSARPAPVIPPIAQVSGQSAEAAALREITDGIQAAREQGRMIVEVALADIAPGYLVRDRIALQRDEIEALKTSIRSHGQRTPAEITLLTGRAGEDGVSPYRFGLISGWRRLRALSELYDETAEARFSTLRALIRPAEDAVASYIAMVEENEIRVGLSYYERARVVAEATARGFFPDRAAALRTLFATASRAKRSKIGSFIEIHDALGDLLRFQAEIPERLGLALVTRLRQGARSAIRAALAAANPTTAEAELVVLTRASQAPRPTVSRAKQAGEVMREGVALTAVRKGSCITLTLTGSGVDDALLNAVRTALRRLT